MAGTSGGRRSRKNAIEKPATRKVICGCGCNKKLTNAQSKRHMRGLAPSFIAISSAYRRTTDLAYIQHGTMPDVPTAPAYLSEGNALLNRGVREGNPDLDMENGGEFGELEENNHEDANHGRTTESYSQPSFDVNIASMSSSAVPQPLSPNDDGASSDSELESSNEEDLEEDWMHGISLDEDPFGWTIVNDELEDDRQVLSAEEMLGEDFEREAAYNDNRITDEDLHILRAFQYKHSYFLTQSAFKALPFVFPQIQIPSFDRIQSRIHRLSGLDTIAFDCCVNSCCCFLGSYENDESCRFCNEQRYLADGKTARKKYSYSPLIPRLRGMYKNKHLCQELLYRHEYERPQSSDGNIPNRNTDDDIASTDIWDGKVYNDLRKRYIKMDGKELQVKYFSDPHDLALGLTTDGFAPWQKRKYTAWPILIVNYNLPPEKRNHQKNLIPLSIIPGPKKPKDIDSFLYPLIRELLDLSNGVRAFDARTGELFCLRAFLITAFGDIPAMSFLLKMKGHNGVTPCRFCNIRGLRIPGRSDNKMHYVPLDRSLHPEAGRILNYDPNQLPMRTHTQFLSNAHLVVTARTRAEEDRLGKIYGIKGKTILINLDSLSFPSSFPYDFMHLIYENLLKNLISLWTNDYKDLDTGTGSYTLSATVWDAIGDATAKASDTIPSTYSTRLGSISGDRSTFTADNYSFWALYIGPIVLQRKFSQQRYYDHFVQLIQLLHMCVKYEYTVGDVKKIREGFVNWVVVYERLYYQHSPARLSTCPLTIHALLHIADGIEACGPVWAYWAFPMERYCGLLQRAVSNSRRHPYVTLDKFIAEDAMLSQLKMRYNLYNELSLQRKGSEGGHHVSTYPTCVLLHPHSTAPLPSNVRDRISAALATRYDVHKSVAKHHVPLHVDQWGRVRRIDTDDGDTMVAALLGRATLDRRDATHIRYQTLVDLNARNRRQIVRLSNVTFYGQLLRIFCFTVAASEDLGLEQSETLIFAEIQPCKILSRHNILDIHYYRTYSTPRVFDISCVQCLVGRVKLESSNSDSDWAIFDRSGNLAQAYYTEGDLEDSGAGEV